MQSRKNKDNEDIRRRSRSLDNQDRDSIDEWLIIPFECQIPIIIYDDMKKQEVIIKFKLL